MNRRFRTASGRLPLLVVLICMSSIVSLAITVLAPQEENSTGSKQVKILANGLELIEVSPSAPQCGKHKGQTIRLNVTSDTPIDVRLFVHTSYKQWLPKDFPNQKRGDEITDYRCGGQKTDYKVYAQAAGSGEAWPKP